MQLNLGDLLEGRYRIEAPIARGGMSTVYRCVDTRLGRNVAAKVMHEEYAGDPIFAQRFRREARSMAHLSHPNLVGVYDFNSDGDHVFLIMELITGGTLRELLAERGAMPDYAASAVMRSVLTGLAAVHNAGMVHRDLKPDNILIDGNHQVKLSDFGLVRAASASQGKSNQIVGTVAYLSPEQVSGDDITTASDVYSAGIVLFELLTGTTPFNGDTPLKHAYARLDADVPKPSSRIDGVPKLMDELVATATARDPKDRFKNADEFLTALNDVASELQFPAFTVPVPQNAAAHRAAGLVELPGLPAVTRQWFAAVETHRDPSGLLIHRRGGDVARGSSQAIIQAFLPDIDPVRAAREWRVFKEQFVVSELGLVGVREYPRGVADDGDVDSGPLVAGVSASASAVTLAAARRNGDLELAKVLDREADLLGLPLPMGSGAAFALGLMPVGDAFVAWARSAPLGAALDVPSPQPWFWLFWLLALVPGVVALWMCRRRIAGLVALRRPGSAGRREECQHIKDGASEPGGSVMNETTVGR